MKTSQANAKWHGNFKEGKGNINLPTSGQELTFTASSRFEKGEPSKTDPEELIAAAHSGCFSMAFAAQLSSKGYQPKLISTAAKVTIEKKGDGFAVTKSELSMTAEIPDISEDEFMELANVAKKGCPVSKALASVDITLDAKLIKS